MLARKPKPTVTDRVKYQLRKKRLIKEREKAIEASEHAREQDRATKTVLKNQRPKNRADLIAIGNLTEISKNITQRRKEMFNEKLLAKRLARGPISKIELKARKLVIGVYPGDQIAFISNSGKIYGGKFIEITTHPFTKKLSILIKDETGQISYLDVSKLKKTIPVKLFNGLTNLNLR